MIKKALLGITVAVVAAGALLTPKAAEAYWVRGGYGYGPGWGWRAPLVVAAPPYAYVVGPVYRPGPYFVRPHYNRFGYFVPGHWQ